MKRLSGIILICLLVVVLAGIAFGAEFQRESLRGLNGVGVVVEKLHTDAVNDGLNREDLQTQVELQLRKSGIKVLTMQEMNTAPGYPYIYLNVATRKKAFGLYAYSIRLFLDQIVVLERNRDIRVTASTWQTGEIGTIGVDNLKEIRQLVNDQLDKFVNDYLAVNPK